MTENENTPGFDFFRAGKLVAPRIATNEAIGLLAEYFGLEAGLTPIGSQQDQNFVVRNTAGEEIAILKIANPAFGDVEIASQDRAAEILASAEPGVRVATVIRHRSGERMSRVVATSRGRLSLRLLRFLPGGTLSSRGYLPPATVERMGELAAAASLALRDFEHPGLDRSLQWNLMHADRVVELLAEHHPDPARRERVLAAARDSEEILEQLATQLPVQPGHFDLTDDNLVCEPEAGLPDGVIDFGDLSRSWAVAELAITISSVLHHAGGEPHAVLPAIRAFHAKRALSGAEIRALWSLVVLRCSVLVASGEHQLSVDPSNEYAKAGIKREWRMFERATSVPIPVMTALIFDTLGYHPRRRGVAAGPAVPADLGEARPPASLASGLTGRIEVLDLSVGSDLADDGAWLAGDLADQVARSRLAKGVGAVVTRFGLPRIDATRPLATESPATVATGVDVWFGQTERLTSPVDGLVSEAGRRTVIQFDRGELVLDGVDNRLSAGDGVVLGAVLGTADRLRVQLRTTHFREVPMLVRPEYAAGWLAQVADPSPWISSALEPGLASGATGGAGDPSDPRGPLLGRRAESLAGVQEHYYDRPPEMARGWRHHLIDVDARAYLDMVNNVTSIGHSHPRVAAAAARQLRQLNTNSRFNYSAVVEFAERLAATLPAPLDTVFLVNSGSEATDLAIRVAVAATGRRDVVAVREAYHGWTYASDAVSTSIADNPNALLTRPPWTFTVHAPNSFRGRYRGPEAGRYGAEAAEFIRALAATGRPPAAFIAETFFGNAGGIALPDGYLDAVYTAVRSTGGLAIADEVQVGYGRLGQWFWGFEQQAVVPDIVAIAKAMGNGYPLGAVITSREVADSYRSQGYFFSSTGGSPLSSVVGVTVLDVIRDESLQQNAQLVGAYLKRKLEDLRQRHSLIGAIHGAGLYLGVELVRDRVTLEPATSETSAICDRLLELGVIMQPTGDHLNVLKVKPPLCLDREAVEFFVLALGRALKEVEG